MCLLVVANITSHSRAPSWESGVWCIANFLILEQFLSIDSVSDINAIPILCTLRNYSCCLIFKIYILLFVFEKMYRYGIRHFLINQYYRRIQQLCTINDIFSRICMWKGKTVENFVHKIFLVRYIFTIFRKYFARVTRCWLYGVVNVSISKIYPPTSSGKMKAM